MAAIPDVGVEQLHAQLTAEVTSAMGRVLQGWTGELALRGPAPGFGWGPMPLLLLRVSLFLPGPPTGWWSRPHRVHGPDSTLPHRGSRALADLVGSRQRAGQSSWPAPIGKQYKERIWRGHHWVHGALDREGIRGGSEQFSH